MHTELTPEEEQAIVALWMIGALRQGNIDGGSIQIGDVLMPYDGFQGTIRLLTPRLRDTVSDILNSPMVHRVGQLTGINPNWIDWDIRQYLGPEYMTGPDGTTINIGSGDIVIPVREIIDAMRREAEMLLSRFDQADEPDEANEFTRAPWHEPGEPYGEDMPGMTLDEFQAYTDSLIREVKGE